MTKEKKGCEKNTGKVGYKVGYKNPPMETRFTSEFQPPPENKGREKGTPNRSTIPRLVLETIAKPPEDMIKEFKDMFPVLFKGKKKKQTVEMLMDMRMAMETFTKGNVAAYSALKDSAYGKPKETLRVGAEEETIEKLENIMRELNDRTRPKSV